MSDRPSDMLALTGTYCNFLRFRCSRTQCTLRSGSRKSHYLPRHDGISKGLHHAN